MHVPSIWGALLINHWLMGQFSASGLQDTHTPLPPPETTLNPSMPALQNTQTLLFLLSESCYQLLPMPAFFCHSLSLTVISKVQNTIKKPRKMKKTVISRGFRKDVVWNLVFRTTGNQSTFTAFRSSNWHPNIYGYRSDRFRAGSRSIQFAGRIHGRRPATDSSSGELIERRPPTWDIRGPPRNGNNALDLGAATLTRSVSN
jgi:hypothetical protein